MKRIVLIDDDLDDGELFREALQQIDQTLLFDHYEDPQTALKELAETGRDLPGLIFLDINMPVVSGWQCLAAFKNIEGLEKVPVVMFTTSSLEKEKKMAKDLGVAGFITKPDDFTVLRELLSSVIHETLR